MGYFPNGSAGEAYMAKYCLRCINWIDKKDGRGAGCPIIDEHMAYNYDQDPKVRNILDALIPRKGVGNGECRMFCPSNPEAE